ncbi:hypothetical protein AVEN_254190-1 [Araneus ventricosus]|uniref:Uncharacterized protein n=1 Tax=Araneus ventricosus TaxID=182803 RepID=A0A4Y2RNN7_ARAVE|nr:hypothetical protein AVEN_254190-1 [Araneus ventricosus]
MSESKWHDAVAICAHLMPVFAKIKTIVPDLRNIHFLSDGHRIEYKKAFYLAATMERKKNKWQKNWKLTAFIGTIPKKDMERGHQTEYRMEVDVSKD